MVAAQDRADLELEHYAWVETITLDHLHGDGSVKKSETRSYDVSRVDGEEYRRLLSKDGKPLPPDERAKEDRKLQERIDKSQEESPAKRAERQKKLEQEREKDRQTLAEVPNAFNFTLLGVRQTPGGPVYVLDAKPIPDYHARTDELRLLHHLAGDMWVSQRDFGLVHMDINVLQPISFGWFLARVASGGKISFDESPVPGAAWFPAAMSGEMSLRLGLIVHMSVRVHEVFSNYRRFQVSSRLLRVVANQPPPK